MNIDAAVQDLIDMILAGMHQQMIGGNNHWILQIITHIYKKNTARSGTRFGRSWCQIWTIVGDGGETFFKFCHPGAEYVGHIWCHQNSIFVPKFGKFWRQNVRKFGKLWKKFWHMGKCETYLIKRIFFKFLKKKVEFPRTVVVDYISIMPTSSVGRPREGVN